jgi:CHASE2 domain-containing sensor protein
MTTFGGKYVFIGEAGSFIHDAQISPVTGTMMDGVESHAHFLDGLLQKRFLQSWDIGDISVFLILI